MDSAIITAIGTVGFSVVACVILWKYIVKKDEDNKSYTNLLVNDRIGDLKNDIKELKIENKEDKDLFRSALTSFDNSVKSFQAIREDITFIKTDLNDIKDRIDEIEK